MKQVVSECITVLQVESPTHAQSDSSFEDIGDAMGEHKFSTDTSCYKLVYALGKGTFGLSTLWVAEYKNSKSQIMLRRTVVDDLVADDLESLQYEMRLSCELAHPNILSFHYSFVSKGEIWTVYPLFNYGSCMDIIQAGHHEGLPELAIVLILKEVVHALEYLHKAGYMHRAVKGSHILVDSSGRICLSGLRYCHRIAHNNHGARVGYNFPSHAVAILPWIAPEVLQQNLLGYNELSDIYSIGITALELATGLVPFSNLSPVEILLEKVHGQMPNVFVSKLKFVSMDFISRGSDSGVGSMQAESRLDEPDVLQPRNLSKSFRQMVEMCLRHEPSERPSAAALHSHPFFKQMKRKQKEISIKEILQPVTPISQFPSPSPSENDDFEAALCSNLEDQLSVKSEWIF